MKHLSEVKFLKLHSLLGLREVSILGWCIDVISPPVSLECCDNVGVLESQVLLVHHISGTFGSNNLIG